MAEPTIQIGGGNWAGKSDNLLGYYKEGERFYKQDFTFSRSTTGTYTDSDGYIQEMPYNLLEYSEDYSQSYWRKDKLTATANSATSPSGLTDAFLIQETTYTNSIPSFDLQSTNTLSVGTYTFSFYVKNNNGRYLGISFGSSGERVRTNFDFNTNTFKTLNLSGSTTGSASYTTLGDYYRISISSTFPSSVAADIVLMPLATDTYPFFAFQDSDNRSFYLWGAQLVKGSSAKTYFPTTTRLNMPRVDYLNNSNGSLILEPQRTNIATYSSDYTQSFYIKDSGITATLNQSTSPTGLNDAAKISVTNNGRIYANHTTGTYATSVFIKAGTFSNFKVQGQNVDLGVTPIVTGSLDSEDYGNGWYRLTGYYTGTRSFQVQAYPDNTYSSHTDSGDYYLFGTQIESGSYPTTLINTSGSSVTRNADACSITNVADRIGQTEGTLFLDIDFINTGGVKVLLSAHDGASNKRLEIWANGLVVNGFIGGSVNIAIGNTTISEGRHKLALAYNQSGDQAFYVDGVQIGTSNTVYNIAALTKLSYGRFNGSSSYAANGNINNTKLYNTRLSNSELATLTTL